MLNIHPVLGTELFDLLQGGSPEKADSPLGAGMG
jgi:hypothetical protein